MANKNGGRKERTERPAGNSTNTEVAKQPSIRNPESLYNFSWWSKSTDAEISSAVSSIDVHARGERDRTPLMMAARNGSPSHIRALLNAGADANAQDEIGWTALMWAARSESPENIEVLLDADADIHLRDKHNRTAFSYAQECEVLRGTVPYWRLANDPNAQRKPLADIATEILRYSANEGRDLIMGGEPSYVNLSLVFDKDRRPIVTKETWIAALKAGEQKRIIGARIDEPGLTAIREHDLPNLLSLDEVEDSQATKELENHIRRFMKDRLKEGPPYFRAIGGHPHWGYQEKYSFRIYSDDVTNGDEVESKIEKFWRYSASAQLSNRVLSISFRNNIGFYISKPDEKLILSWAGQSANDGEEQIISRDNMRMKDSAKHFTRLVYARLAEKAAISIYSSLSGSTVEDCSILQTEGKDNRWRDFDIWASKPLDVKNTTVYRQNARQNFVPKFKRSGNQDVVISAFATARGTFGGVEQTYLGEVSQHDLALSRSAVQRAFPGLETIQVRFDDQHLPAWSFEYPFGEVNYDELLDAYLLLGERPESILAAALAAGKVHEIGAYTRLSGSQRRIIDLFSQVILDSTYSKRTIVLFAVSGFISEVLSGGTPLRFMRFFRRLFQMEELGRRYEDRVGAKMCTPFPESKAGGLPDPLRSVHNMFDLLERAAEEISASGLDFEAFHAQNPHVLLGRLKGGRQITVYAYCGGRSESGIPCDTFPLVVGNNDTCRRCGKLVCHECGFCSSGCTSAT
ncbi:ankyrin repeat domain-containing protein [Roseovarius aestuariivivens]|uniref:ankyrin repeat domain-containing protein n=1 Tax=Roseovarius aestuariivivens TaxID=1888910 RepID=UPI001081502E|nr:ankyrin repeat domain-containing protein [Roseovarius aestuariivivens]